MAKRPAVSGTRSRDRGSVSPTRRKTPGSAKTNPKRSRATAKVSSKQLPVQKSPRRRTSVAKPKSLIRKTLTKKQLAAIEQKEQEERERQDQLAEIRKLKRELALEKIRRVEEVEEIRKSAKVDAAQARIKLMAEYNVRRERRPETTPENLEVRSKLTKEQAMLEAKKAAYAMAETLSLAGCGTSLMSHIERDGTVDVHLVAFTGALMLESNDQITEVRDLLKSVARTMARTGIHDDIWFSIRPFYEAGSPVDELGQIIVESSGKSGGTMDLGETDVEYDEDALQKNREGDHSLNYQRRAVSMFGQAEVAADNVTRFLDRNQNINPLVSTITVRFHWNQFVITPQRLR